MRHVRTVVFSFVAACAAAGAAAQSRGQITGDVRGTVLDQAGAPIGGATVTARERGTGLQRSVLSAAGGGYELLLLPPGSYDVTCSLVGFSDQVQSQVRVAVGSVTGIDCTLSVVAAPESIDVVAQPSAIEPGRTQVSQVVGPERIQMLPINERDFLSFTLITPGVNTDRAPLTGAAANSGLSFFGQSARYNNVMVDGLDNNDNASGSVRSTFSQDAVQEFQVLAGGYSAEYGRALGGVVNIVTRSGTNRWSGSLFGFDRRDGLDSRNALAREGEEAPFSRHQVGATLGGPLRRDRTFFFAAAEALRVEDTNVVTVSSQAAAAIQRAGFALETGAVPFERTSNTAFLRLDEHMGAHRLTLRYNYAEGRNENQEPWGGLVARSRGGAQDTVDHTASFALGSVLGTSALHEARVLYARREIDIDTLDAGGGPSVRILGVAEFGRELNLPHARTQDQVQFVDSLTVTRGSHSLKAGVDVNHVRYETNLPNVLGGFHVFAAVPPLGLNTALAAFERGVPALTLQSFGDDHDAFRTTLLSAYLQDDWRLGRGLRLQVGVRYDNERLPDPFPRDDDDVSPRLGLAWTDGAMRTNVRATAGRYHGSTSLGPILGPRLFGSGRLRLRQFSFPLSAQVYAQPGHRLAVEPTTGLLNTFEISPDFESNYTDQATLGVDRALSSNLSVSLSGTLARGRHVLVARNVNAVDPATGFRPDRNRADVTVQESTGDSWYRGLILAVDKRMSGGTQLSLAYTLSRAEDDFIDWFGRFQPQDKRHPELDEGLSFQDERHRLVASGLWDLTRDPGRHVLLRDWQLGGIVTYGSGRPFNVLAGFDRNRDGEASSDRPEGRERNSGEGPDFLSVDLRIARVCPLGGDRRLEIIAEVFNLLDRANYSRVNEVFGPGPDPLPTFGQPVLAFAPRQIQLGARFVF